MILVTGSVKGGVGKTTLAVNLTIGLAMLGADVLLIDGDEQATASAFTQIRAALVNPYPKYTAVALHGAAIRTQLRLLRPRYHHIVVDVGGRDSGSLRAALTVSDLLLIPAAPRSFDLWGVDQTADLVREAREINENLRAVAVLNGADPAGKDNADALAALADLDGIEVSPHFIGRRKAYPNAAAAGLSVLEYSDAGNRDGVLKARAELKTLLHYLVPVMVPALERISA
ncbi:MAG: AAA family ATPase [Terracidiphilus sp.]